MCFSLSGGDSPSSNQVISWYIDKSNHDSSRTMKYYHPWCSAERRIVKSLFDICTLAASCASFSLWGTQRRCFTTKPIEFVSRHHTVVAGMHVLLDMLRTDKNSSSSNVVSIIWSKTPGPSDIGFASLSGVQSSPLRYLFIVECAIAFGPRAATSFPWMVEADNLCLSRNKQIER
jgi:hypothetical protein